MRVSVVVITTAQLYSTKPELRFCAGSNLLVACRLFENFTQINKKNLHHFIHNIHNLSVTFLPFTETAIRRCFS